MRANLWAEVCDPDQLKCHLLPLQVADCVREDELLNVFRHFGEILSHRLLRSTHCAFLDFASSAAAAAARVEMHGSKLGGQLIKVEFKVSCWAGGR